MPTPETARPDTAHIYASGPVNGMGEPDPSGSYVRIKIATRDGDQFHRISLGAAEVLSSELAGVLMKKESENAS